MNTKKLPKLLIFIVAYQAESTIISVLSRIPESVARQFEVEVLIIDDSSNKEFLNSTKFKLKRDKNNFPIFNSKNLAKELVTSIKAILDKKSN